MWRVILQVNDPFTEETEVSNKAITFTFSSCRCLWSGEYGVHQKGLIPISMQLHIRPLKALVN